MVTGDVMRFQLISEPGIRWPTKGDSIPSVIEPFYQGDQMPLGSPTNMAMKNKCYGWLVLSGNLDRWQCIHV